MMADAGTATTDPTKADGILDFWINGVEYGPFNKQWLRTCSDVLVNILWFSIYFHQGNPGTMGYMVDDVAISTTYIGPDPSEINSVPGETYRVSKFQIENVSRLGNSQTSIRYAIPNVSQVQIKIYNQAGQEIRTLVNENKTSGTYTVLWDGKNTAGKKTPAGIYICCISAGKDSRAIKLLLL